MGFLLGLLPPPVVSNAFSPTSLANLLGWWEADSLVTSSSGLVSSWGDKSGAGDSNRNAVSTTQHKPSAVASNAAFNNLPTIHWTAADPDQLATGTWSIAPIVQPFTIFLVMAVPAPPGGNPQYIVDNGAHNMFLFNPGAPDQTEMYAGGAPNIASTTSHTAAHVWACVYNGASSALYKDDHTNAVASGTISTNGFSSLSFGLDSPQDSSVGFNGDIAAILVQGNASSATDRGNLFTYWGAKYGITVA